MTKNYVVVSGAALSSSGALTILKQFIENASKNNNDYIVFIPENVELPVYENIEYIRMLPMSWANRIHWDWYGIQRFIKNEKLSVKKVICLQNTSLNVNNNQIIYLHQPIPFSKSHGLLKSLSFQNIKLFLYKIFYSYFIFKFVDDKTTIVVQTEWMKDGVLEKCKMLMPEQVIVIKPDIKAYANAGRSENIKRLNNTIIYPATPLSYKNHIVILDALVVLREQYKESIVFQVTFNKGDYKYFDSYVDKKSLRNNIQYLGVLPFSELQRKYQESSLVVFPSYIESYGLPLIEAASLGKLILCSDLPYSRDVLSDYSGAVFIEHYNVNRWAQEIYTGLLKNSQNQFDPYINDERSSWAQFFNIV